MTEIDSVSVPPRILVVILNWNGLSNTVSCVKGAMDSSYKDLDIVVIDNGSANDEGLAIGNEFGGRVRVIRLEKNLGFAAGSNKGIQIAKESGYKYVLLLNNDAVVESSAISNLANIAERNPDGGVFGPLIVDYQDRTLVQQAGGRISLWRASSFSKSYRLGSMAEDGQPSRTHWLSGAALLIRTKAIEEVGLFDTLYFAYSEETDLEFRMLRMGWNLYLVPKAVAYHKTGSSTNLLSQIRINGWTRNKFIFLRKFARPHHIFAFVFYYVLYDVPYNLTYGILHDASVVTMNEVTAFIDKVKKGIFNGIFGDTLVLR